MPSGNGNPSPTVREDALAIESQFKDWAKARGGLVKIMENESHLWEEMYNPQVATTAPRILILNQGETARGEYAGGDRTDLHRVDRQWLVVVMRGHGFKNLTAVGIGQPNTAGSVEAFSDSWETIRDGIRVMSNISEEFPVDYKGTRPLPNIAKSDTANIFLDCRAIEFSTAADIPRILNGTTG